MQIIQLQVPGMEAIAAITGSCRIVDVLIVEIQRITKQWRPQLSQMDANLVRAAGCDGQLQPVPNGAAFQQGHFGVCLQASPGQPT